MFFDQFGVEEFGECPSELSVLPMSEGGVWAAALEAALIAEFGQRDGEGL